MKTSNEQLDDRVVEVHWDPVGEHWRMMRFRDDKPHGNHKSVVDNIIKSIADGVEKDAVRIPRISPSSYRLTCFHSSSRAQPPSGIAGKPASASPRAHPCPRPRRRQIHTPIRIPSRPNSRPGPQTCRASKTDTRSSRRPLGARSPGRPWSRACTDDLHARTLGLPHAREEGDEDGQPPGPRCCTLGDTAACGGLAS